ncbi:MAG TPA: TAXI family TRAP transporter solute-binding subunit [Stellaceae bacterium]|nr:TAXI family TRAP transporter solute-binding subunit [Stellaceae bacterium]
MQSRIWKHRRLLAAAFAGLVLAAGAASATAADAAVDRANRGLVYIATSSVLGTDVRIAEDLANVLDDGATRRIVPMVGKGSLQNLMDLKVLRGIDVAIVQADVLDFAKAQRSPPGVDQIPYIAKLYNEEFHLLARADVKSIEDLAGKKVSFGLQGDGTNFTGARLFDLLKIKVSAVNFDQATALEKLRSGEIAALAYVAGKPAPLFLEVRQQDHLHFLAIPLKPEIASAYIPARLTSDDYPNAVPTDGSVDTVAVGAVMVAANLIPDSERNRNVASFVEAFFTQFPKLLEEGHHPKWNEVNLAAELPGWRRYGAADSWIKRNGGAPVAVNEQQMREIFTRFLDERTRSNNGQALTAQQKDELFDQFKKWQEGKVR